MTAGSFPFGNDISGQFLMTEDNQSYELNLLDAGVFPQYVNIRRAAVIMGIFCLISCP
jgi:hypothetical protein